MRRASLKKILFYNKTPADIKKHSQDIRAYTQSLEREAKLHKDTRSSTTHAQHELVQRQVTTIDDNVMTLAESSQQHRRPGAPSHVDV